MPLLLALLAALSWRSPMTRGMVWAGALLFSYDGWGRAVAYGLKRTGRVQRTDLGLRLGWGVAATLLVGGIACMVHIAARPFLIGQITVGWALSVASRVIEPPPWMTDRRWRAFFGSRAFLFVLGLAAVGTLVEGMHGVAMTWTNMSDDEPLYFFLPQKLLATGTLYDPFDVRRMTSYGGQFYLHAQYLVAGPHHKLNVVDAGIGTFLVMAHVVSEAARAKTRRGQVLVGVLAVLLVLTIDSVRLNVGSLMTSFAAVVATHRTWCWIRRGETRTPLDLALVAVCGVTAFVLRTSCAVPVSMFFALSVGLDAWRSPRPRWRLALQRVVLLGAAFFFVLLPWLVLYRQSTGTLIYPLTHGNLTPGFAILKVEPGVAYNLTHLLGDLAYSKPVSTSLILLIAAFVPVAWNRARPRPGTMQADAPLLASIVLVCLCFTSVMGGAFVDSSNARYYFAFLMWGLLATTWGSGNVGGGSQALVPSPRALVVAFAVLLHVAAMRNPLRDHLVATVAEVEAADYPELRAAYARTQRLYRDAQRSVPAGAGIAAMVQDPFRFDMKRNEVESLDLGGGMGPAPGFPNFKGADALADYLIANGLPYLITVDFELTYRNMELFDLPAWRRHRLLQHSFLNYEAPFVVDAMESVEQLSKTRRPIFKNEILTVVDLREPVAAPESSGGP